MHSLTTTLTQYNLTHSLTESIMQYCTAVAEDSVNPEFNEEFSYLLARYK